MVLAGERDEPVGGRGADPAPRGADGAAERLRVGRVGQQRQVGERVADLGALVQAERAEHAVRDPGMRERALQRLGRVPGPGEREDLRRRHSRRRARRRSAPRPRAPRRARPRAHDPDVPAGAAHRDQRLRRAPLVVAHAPDGGVEDLRARAEVAPEHDPPVAGVRSPKREDVARVGVPPAVDQLVVVAAHAQVAVRAGEQVDERRLRVAGVLELVGQQPPPSLAKPREPVRVLAQQPHREREQVVERPRVAALQLDARPRATRRRSAARPGAAERS